MRAWGQEGNQVWEILGEDGICQRKYGLSGLRWGKTVETGAEVGRCQKKRRQSVGRFFTSESQNHIGVFFLFFLSILHLYGIRDSLIKRMIIILAKAIYIAVDEEVIALSWLGKKAT